MKAPRDLRYVLACAAVIAALGWGSQVTQGQGQAADSTAAIQSLAETGETLAVKSTSEKTGLVTFASSPGRGILVPLGAAAPADQRALSFVELYGARFGITDRSQLLLSREPRKDEIGIEHVRFQQVHQGIPVRGGEFMVHLNGSRVTAANGLVVKDLPDDIVPNITAGSAQDAARQLVAKYKPAAARGAQYSEPRLEIFNKGVLSTGIYPSRLAWFVEATDLALRQYIWVDAQTGTILMQFSQLTDALSRTVYNSNFTASLPGTLVRTEGGPATGDPDSDNAYTLAGVTYNYYLSQHNRNSFDNAGGAIISSVHYCPDSAHCPNYANAFWNGTQMVYGNTYASADDVVGHELTHAVTERSANLLYYNQSGAMNESFSDIFGETIDQTDGLGNDTPGVKWSMGEDLPIGAIRNMMNPNVFGDPGRMSDSLYFNCSEQAWDDPDADHGGVHGNSGIPNHAYALMVDGGSYNGQVITGIGTTKAAKIEYRALTVYLTSGSGFLDDFNALNQSCTDLIGTAGITAADCTQVNKALLAVEMNATWACSGATAPPSLCPTGTPAYAFQDTFEAVTSNWTPSTTGAGVWNPRDSGLAHGGVFMAFGTDAASASDAKLAMSSSVVVPAGGRLYFDTAYEFESDGFGTYFDGGKIEYSTNGGATWFEAGGLIDAGRGYSATISPGTAIGGQTAFAGSSFGYTATRLNLASLAGLSARFRFRVVSDGFVGSLGWAVDNFRIYSCTTAVAPVITLNPSNQTVNAGQTASFSAAASGTPAPTVQWQVSTGGPYADIPGATSTTYSFTTAPGDTGKSYHAVFTNSAGSAISNPATLTVNSVAQTLTVSKTGSGTGTVTSSPAGIACGATCSASFTFGISVTLSATPAAGSSFAGWSGSGCTGTGSCVVAMSAARSVAAQFTRQTGSLSVTLGGLPAGTIVTLAITGPNGFSTTNATLTGTGFNLSDVGTGTYTVTPPLKTVGSTTYSAPVQSVAVNFGTTGTINVTYSPQIAAEIPNDFDGNGRSDLAVFRPAGGQWFINGVSSPLFGLRGDIPVPGDYDGNGLADVAVYRPSTGQWFISGGSPGLVQWGRTGDIPVPADYDGDKKTDTAVWRTTDSNVGVWLLNLPGGQVVVPWGARGDIPIPGDYDGDGRADLALYRPSTGQWLLAYAAGNFLTTGIATWGIPGDIPIRADLDNDHRLDFVVYRPSTGTWYMAPTNSPTTSFQFGLPGDMPLSLDLDGDGWGELCVWRPATGTWFIRNRVTATTSSMPFGVAGDIPVGQRLRPASVPVSDFDGDGVSDITVFRPSTGTWFTRFSSTAFATSASTQFGLNGDLTVNGDYDGDRRSDQAVYRPSTGEWFILQSSNGGVRTASWGIPGDKPMPADYDGDGRTDLAVFRPSTAQWFIVYSSNNAGAVFQWGLSTDQPFANDFDGDGRADLAVYRPSSGQWFLLLSTTAFGQTIVRAWGLAGDVPMPADFDGDGRSEFAIFRPSTAEWIGIDALNGGLVINRQWGLGGDIPVPHDYDGDGVIDPAVFRGNGNWFIRRSSNGGLMQVQLGLSSDQPR